MLFKSMNLLNKGIINSNNSLVMMGVRSFASGKTFSTGDSSRLGDNFKFPKHNEIFNDQYYDAPSDNPYANKSAGPSTMSEDYVDPNNPFVSENPFVPGGILASYKKRAGLNATEVMEQNYWN